MTILLGELAGLCKSVTHVGSRVSCNPPPTNTDDDWLCVVLDWREFVGAASRHGFTFGGSFRCDEIEEWVKEKDFVSMRREQDNLNLIITSDDSFAKRFIAATSVAKRLNLMLKEDRVALFQAVLYGNGDIQ